MADFVIRLSGIPDPAEGLPCEHPMLKVTRHEGWVDKENQFYGPLSIQVVACVVCGLEAKGRAELRWVDSEPWDAVTMAAYVAIHS